MKRKIVLIALMSFAILASSSIAYADINLTIRDGNDKIFEGSVPLVSTGTVDLNDNTNTPHSINTQSVLSLVNDTDTQSDAFTISDLEYFPSFGSLYLKCITSTITGEKCDNWQYTVNNTYPGVGMDQKILSDGDTVYVYFGSQYKIVLDANTMSTEETLVATSQEYNYQDNNWETRTGVTIGLTQSNPDDPWNPFEIQISTVDINGQASFSSIPEGSYNIGIKEDFYFPTEALTVTTTPSSSSSSSGGSSRRKITEKEDPIKSFNLEKAISFLSSEQKEDGSFGEEIYTDWVTLALASGNNQNQILKLVKHFGESKISGTLLTDFERHAMTLMALGLNPYNTSGENYIKKITDAFDGKQFGDTNEDNDDIFALIVLQNTGFSQTDQMIVDTISFVLSKQKENGSWDESIDMTGATIQALISFEENEEVKKALTKAKEFLEISQKEDGGWGNVSSTAWAIGGILALSEKPENWEKKDKNPLDYLATSQDTDGGIENEYLPNRIWETAYVVTALSGKTWTEIMQKFEKPIANITLEEKEALEQKLERVLALLEEIKTENKAIKLSIAKNTQVQPSQNLAAGKILSKENEVAKIENQSSQNTATVINSLDIEEAKPADNGWFTNILDTVFNIF